MLGGDAAPVIDKLNRDHGSIQGKVMKRVVLKSTPVLPFLHDASASRGVDLVNLRATDTIPVELHPTAVVLDEAHNALYVANTNSDSVSRIDTARNTVTHTIPLQPFRQIESTLARRHEGTGLGLPLTKAIVEMHGGRLDLQSTPGKGTTATVTFPVERVIDPHGVQDAQLAEAIHAARNAL